MKTLAGALSLVLLALAGPLLASGCGGSEYADKCAAACKPKKPCADEDPAKCQAACEAALEGLAAACAQCVVEQSGWSGSTCTCDAAGCDLCSYPDGECFGGDTLTCDPSKDNACDGFDLGKTSGSTCKSACAKAG